MDMQAADKKSSTAFWDSLKLARAYYLLRPPVTTDYSVRVTSPSVCRTHLFLLLLLE
jgi:hypothetical protein